VTAIGEAMAGEGAPRFVDQEGRTFKFARGSFSHF